MTIVEELKVLAATMKGSGTPSDIPGDTVAEVIAWIAANWEDIKSAIVAP